MKRKEELRKVPKESPETVFHPGDYGRFDGI